MSLRLRKVTYAIHFDQLDDDGNTIGEWTTQVEENGAPFALFPHQLDELPKRVEDRLTQAESQLSTPET